MQHAGCTSGSLAFQSSCGLHLLSLKVHARVCFEELLIKQQNISKESIGDDVLKCFHMFSFQLPKPLAFSLNGVMLHVCLISMHVTNLLSAFFTVL